MSKMMARAAPLLILAMLALALLPVMPASAILIDDVDPDADYYGRTVKVYVIDVTAGYDVELYWDLVQAWDGTAGLINTTTAGAAGTAEIWFDVPEAVAGSHYLWVVDTRTGETDFIEFIVETYVKVSPSSGLPTDDVTVKGYGFGKTKDVAILLVASVPPDGLDEVNETVVADTEGATEFSFTLDNTPVEPGSVYIKAWINGTLYTLVDQGDGTLLLAGVAEGVINYVTGEVEVTFEDEDAPDDDTSILADYEYYEDVPNTIYVFTTAVDSSALGSFSTTVTVPSTTDMTYGDYYVYAYDAVGNDDDAAFTIGPVITLSIDEGPVGSVVEIRGRGFTAEEWINETEVTIIDDVPVVCWIEEEVQVDADGEFRVDIVIPQVEETGDYEIAVDEDGDGFAEATADFEVTGLAEIELEPEYGAPGDTVTIYGYNFTQIKGVDVVVFIDEDDDGDIDTGETVGTFETTAEGEFTGTFSVPAFVTETYDVIARQADYNIEDSASFRIGLMYVILSPTEGATGDLVTITGVGFEENGTWNATFNGIAITEAAEPVSPEGALVTDGGALHTFYVPTVEPGTYTITVLDIVNDIEVTTTFEVTNKTMVTLSPSEAPNEYTITIKGWHFAEKNTWAAADLEFILWNETEDWDITVEIYDEEWDIEGNFTAKWDIWSSDDLDLGTYYINVTDGEGLYATATLVIVEAIIECAPRLTEYHIGDTVAFDIKSSFPQNNSYIKIYDPEGNLYWKTDAFRAPDKWLKVDLYYTVPYYQQVAAGNPLSLPPDAPTGTWSWTWYDEDAEEIASGNFTVTPAIEVLLEERIASVEESVEALSEDVAGLSEDLAAVATDVAELSADVASAIAAAEAAEEAASAAQEAVTEVADVASAAKAAAEEAKTAAEEAKTAATGLTPLIYGAIGVSLVAALAAIVSLIQISRRIAG